jgi:hypothetical protein
MRFAPTWTEFEKKVNGGEIVAKDAEGSAANVRVLKLNCVDFDETCTNQKVHGFPTMRLYRRGTGSKQSYVGYEGERNVEGVNRFMQGEVAKRHLHTGSTFHEQFAEGCRISGNMDVARVPGTVHFQAQHTRENVLNLAFTNVSHEVNHFSFGEAPRRSIYHLPEEYKRHVSPLDGRSFTVDKFHQAPNHFIKVVHTRFEASGLRSYQQTHQSSVRTLQRSSVPQAKFSYDLSPVEVIITKGDRRWYDFVTKIFAIIGGAYTIMSLAASSINLTGSAVKSLLGKDN